MKLFKETEDGTYDKKLFKSQMERRRRERMNRSLERLRSILLQGPQLRKVEKAEVLEHTVLFLQSTDDKARKKEGGGDQRHSFQDGFSACLQRATHFLGPQGEGLHTAVTLHTALTVHLSRSDNPGFKSANSIAASSISEHPVSPKSLQAILQRTHMQRSKHGRTAPALHVRRSAVSKPLAVRHENPRVDAQSWRPSPFETRMQGQGTTDTRTQRLPASQSLWRPWP